MTKTTDELMLHLPSSQALAERVGDATRRLAAAAAAAAPSTPPAAAS